ncbi:MAG: hypothetical protein WB239_05265 [Acidimicrobiia bacterium]
MTEGKPSLTVVPADADADVVDEAETAPTPQAETPPPPAPITLSQQITSYAGLVAHLKKTNHLSEGTIVKLIELALNERFTLIQLGLAGPRPSIPAPEEEPADGTSAQD